MKAYEILFAELDKCEFVIDYEYKGKIEDYTYNGITYSQSSEFYFNHLKKLYNDFKREWTTLSEEDKAVAKSGMKLIFDVRFMYNDFFFDVPNAETVSAMRNDIYVPKRNVEMAFFLYQMAEQQKFFLKQVTDFLNLTNKTSTTEESEATTQSHFSFDKKTIKKIEELYDKCTEFDSEMNITKSNFVCMFEKADFSETLKENGDGRHVVYFVTYYAKQNIINKKVEEEWFTQVCSSLKKTKKKVRDYAYESKYWDNL